MTTSFSKAAALKPGTYRACSGLREYDKAVFHGGPPVLGAVKRSGLGYDALFQARLRKVREVEVEASRDLVLIMIGSVQLPMEIWLDGTFQGAVQFRRGDLILLPPGLSSRWCGPNGQPSVFHLHIAIDELALACGGNDSARITHMEPAVQFRDPRLQRLMQALARIDDETASAPLEVAALGSAALLRLLEQPPSAFARN